MVLTGTLLPDGQHTSVFTLHGHMTVEVVLRWQKMWIKLFYLSKEADIVHLLGFADGIKAKKCESSAVDLALVLF